MLSKVCERLHIDRHSILNEKISGYRKGHSRTTLLLCFRDDIIHAMKWNEITMAVFPDLSKAFDTVDRSHQDSWKNAQMGYMREKRQFAQANDLNIRADWHAIQGSTGFDIGLALSTLYANDLNDNHDCTAFHINMQTTRLSWSTVPLQIWTLPLAPCKPSKSGQAIPTYCLMQNRPKNYDMHRKNVKSAK